MRSRAQIGSHPIHPILVTFPIAFFTGTLLAHLAGWIMERPDFIRTAYFLNIAGIVAAILAAVPGLIDYLHTVPPKSSGKKRAARHGLLNVTMLLIFTIAFFYRRDGEASNVVLLVLELAGMTLMGIAGWMGGTLVYRNQIGVDMRYAHAGKWNEERFDQETGRIQVGKKDELKINAMKLLHFKDRRIVLARTEKSFVAFDDRCPHKGGSLAGGSMMCGTVQCPWHGSQFSVTTGTLEAGPSDQGIPTYPVEEQGGLLFLNLSPGSGSQAVAP